MTFIERAEDRASYVAEVLDLDDTERDFIANVLANAMQATHDELVDEIESDLDDILRRVRK